MSEAGKTEVDWWRDIDYLRGKSVEYLYSGFSEAAKQFADLANDIERGLKERKEK